MSSAQRFVDFLKVQIGLEVDSVGISVVERAVRQRIANATATDADSYWQLLQHSAQERQALIEAVIVPETCFFRYPASFVALVELAGQRLHSLAGSRPLRILSLPCATGEEPYSIVMALFDAGIAAAQFQVDALDVSPRLIERAQQARYGNNSFRGAQLSFRDRYFSAIEHGYALDESIRQRVHFQCGNLLDPALLAGQPPYDLLLCRNLLIYFDQATQATVMTGFKRLARQDGVIFVGPAEANLASRLGLQRLGIPQAFAFRYADAAAPVEPAPLPLQRKAIGQAPAVPVRGLDGRAKRPPKQPSRPTAAKLAPPPEASATAQLQAIANLANQGNIAEAQQRCERLLADEGPCAEAFYWLGLLSDASGKPGLAQGFYRKALYLHPQHPQALRHLAALLAAQGDLAAARHLRVRAAQGVDKNA